MLVLAGIAVIVLGFLLRFNPLLVVTVAAGVTGWAAGLSPLAILATLGKAFNDVRYVSIIWIVLPVIGLLEHHGLQEQARRFVARFGRATAGRLLIAYLLFRQLTAAVGLMSIAGPAHTVRPLVAPMAEADLVGIERLLLGTDYSFPPADLAPLASLKAAGFSTAQIEEVSEGNVRRMFSRLR